MKQDEDESLIDDRDSLYQSSLPSEIFDQHFKEQEGLSLIGQLVKEMRLFHGGKFDTDVVPSTPIFLLLLRGLIGLTSSNFSSKAFPQRADSVGQMRVRINITIVVESLVVENLYSRSGIFSLRPLTEAFRTVYAQKFEQCTL